MPRIPKYQWLTSYLAEHFPEWSKLIADEQEEVAKAGTWLVGLATAVLALFIANPERVPFVSVVAGKWIVGLLAATVLCVVVQRVISLLGRGSELRARLHFIGYLHGFQSGGGDSDPLADWWPAEEIVRRLKEHYELDYAFMLGRDDSLNRLRDVYAGTFDSWRDLDQTPLKQLAAKFAAYAGEPADRVEQQLVGTATAETAAMSANTHHRLLAIMAHILYVLSSALFCTAILIFAGSFLAR